MSKKKKKLPYSPKRHARESVTRAMHGLLNVRVSVESMGGGMGQRLKLRAANLRKSNDLVPEVLRELHDCRLDEYELYAALLAGLSVEHADELKALEAEGDKVATELMDWLARPEVKWGEGFTDKVEAVIAHIDDLTIQAFAIANGVTARMQASGECFGMRMASIERLLKLGQDAIYQAEQNVMSVEFIKKHTGDKFDSVAGFVAGIREQLDYSTVLYPVEQDADGDATDADAVPEQHDGLSVVSQGRGMTALQLPYDETAYPYPGEKVGVEEEPAVPQDEADSTPVEAPSV